MKKLFDEYGHIILAILGILVLIMVLSPIGTKIEDSLKDTVNKFETHVSVLLDKSQAEVDPNNPEVNPEEPEIDPEGPEINPNEPGTGGPEIIIPDPETPQIAISPLDVNLLRSNLKNLTGTITFSQDKFPANFKETSKLKVVKLNKTGSIKAIIDKNTKSAIIYDANTYGINAPKDCLGLFSDFRASHIDLRGLDTSNTTRMTKMFENCTKLKSVNLSNTNTSKVERMYRMFAECRSLESIDLSNFDTSNTVNMGTMFWNCASLTALDLSPLETNESLNTLFMFHGCKSMKTLDLSSFNMDIIDAYNASLMFFSCDKLETVYVKDKLTKDFLSESLGGCHDFEFLVK